jgi:hypothetical protein
MDGFTASPEGRQGTRMADRSYPAKYIVEHTTVQKPDILGINLAG